MTYTLDDEWIKKFDEIDNLYKDFYKDDVNYVNITFLYLNKENTISHINQEPFLFNTPNKISKEDMIHLIKDNIICYKKKYRIKSILKYNFFLDVDDVKSYLKNGPEELNYLSSINYIEDIYFQKTITMFHDLNEIILIFQEIVQDNKFKTKKYRIPLPQKKNQKKTIRKRFKD